MSNALLTVDERSQLRKVANDLENSLGLWLFSLIAGPFVIAAFQVSIWAVVLVVLAQWWFMSVGLAAASRPLPRCRRQSLRLMLMMMGGGVYGGAVLFLITFEPAHSLYAAPLFVGVVLWAQGLVLVGRDGARVLRIERVTITHGRIVDHGWWMLLVLTGLLSVPGIVDVLPMVAAAWTGSAIMVLGIAWLASVFGFLRRLRKAAETQCRQPAS